MMALFDNEEVGSVSAYGAESNFIESVIERVAVALKGDGETEAEAYQRTLAKSFLLSCVGLSLSLSLSSLRARADDCRPARSTDVAHSVHPGFVEKHEDNHRPLINSGIVIKTNSKQRYATTSNTVFPLRRVAAEAGVPLTEFVVRNDCACGSTSASLSSLVLSLFHALIPSLLSPSLSDSPLALVRALTLSPSSSSSPARSRPARVQDRPAHRRHWRTDPLDAQHPRDGRRQGHGPARRPVPAVLPHVRQGRHGRHRLSGRGERAERRAMRVTY